MPDRDNAGAIVRHGVAVERASIVVVCDCR
jgi:hypothetical protein